VGELRFKKNRNLITIKKVGKRTLPTMKSMAVNVNKEKL
jgi:hypothetical protein